jgi:hypothetical protein
VAGSYRSARSRFGEDAIVEARVPVRDGTRHVKLL